MTGWRTLDGAGGWIYRKPDVEENGERQTGRWLDTKHDSHHY